MSCVRRPSSPFPRTRCADNMLPASRTTQERARDGRTDFPFHPLFTALNDTGCLALHPSFRTCHKREEYCEFIESLVGGVYTGSLPRTGRKRLTRDAALLLKALHIRCQFERGNILSPHYLFTLVDGNPHNPSLSFLFSL